MSKQFQVIWGNINDYFFDDREAPFSETVFFYLPIIISVIIIIFTSLSSL